MRHGEVPPIHRALDSRDGVPDIPRRCTWPVATDPVALCSRPAMRHIIYWWEDDLPPGDVYGYDHGYACLGHWREFRRRWKCASSHDLGPDCGMPGSFVYFDGERSWCSMDELPVAEPSRELAEAAA